MVLVTSDGQHNPFWRASHGPTNPSMSQLHPEVIPNTLVSRPVPPLL